MTYIDMVRNAPEKSEEIMWQSVEAVSDLVEKLKVSHPEMAREFLMKEHSRMYGPHFNEEMAKEEVSKMHHTAMNGETINGEMISVEQTYNMLPSELREQGKWDAYIGVNAFMHDLAKTDISTEDISRAAIDFWFDDEDFPIKDKVWWYFSNK